MNDDNHARLEHSDTHLVVHDPDKCAGEHCTVHNRSDHPMRHFRQYWRWDRGFMERICPHGVGHPDPDEPWPTDDPGWIHGCDGCCTGAYKPGTDTNPGLDVTTRLDRLKTTPLGLVIGNPPRDELAGEAADTIRALRAEVDIKNHRLDDLHDETNRLRELGNGMVNAINHLLDHPRTEPTEDLTELLAAWREATHAR